MKILAYLLAGLRILMTILFAIVFIIVLSEGDGMD